MKNNEWPFFGYFLVHEDERILSLLLRLFEVHDFLLLSFASKGFEQFLQIIVWIFIMCFEVSYSIIYTISCLKTQ